MARDGVIAAVAHLHKNKMDNRFAFSKYQLKQHSKLS
jgi:hypothetical protein